jgi:hypothetical protein
MAKQTLLFVDTNIFLDFYRAGGEAGLTLLEHIEKVADVLIMTDQLEMEFLNNRQTVISAALAKLTAPAIPSFVPAFLLDSQNAAGIEKNIQQIKKRVETMKQRYARCLKDPSVSDPVFKTFKGIVAKSSRNLKAATAEERKEILTLANERYQRGFPPRKKQDQSIGDAINWEWILACAKGIPADVLIVSRDSDYGLLSDGGYLNDWLAQEFKEKVSIKKKAQLFPSLTQALKKLGVKVTAAEEKEEQNIIKQTPAPVKRVSRGVPELPLIDDDDTGDGFEDVPPFWHSVRGQLLKASPFLHSYLLEAASITFSNDTLEINFAPEFAEHVTLVDNARNKVALQTILKSLGVCESARIVFRASVPNPVAAGDSAEPPPPDDDVPF